jgi:hypothetical protein
MNPHLISWKRRHGISDDAFQELLCLQNIAPQSSMFSSSDIPLAGTLASGSFDTPYSGTISTPSFDITAEYQSLGSMQSISPQSVMFSSSDIPLAGTSASGSFNTPFFGTMSTPFIDDTTEFPGQDARGMSSSITHNADTLWNGMAAPVAESPTAPQLTPTEYEIAQQGFISTGRTRTADACARCWLRKKKVWF